MGMSLVSYSGSSRYERTDTWAGLLMVAMNYGWRPAGTRQPILSPEDGWEGSYTLNEGQHVNAADAGSLADALELALLNPDTESDAANDDAPFVEVRFPGPNDKAGLKELITFCREGPFTIS